MGAVFVHLSDIHFGQEKGRQGEVVVNEDARDQLIEDAGCVVASLEKGKASGIILTGDIAYAGKAHEYRTAGEWLDTLASEVGCQSSDIQMVPGNHDMDRDHIKGGTALMLKAIHDGGEPALDTLLVEGEDREVLYLRFAAYRDFANAYQCPLDCMGKNTAERTVELAPGRAIRFVRLNSALTCGKRSSDDYGKLLLGAGQRVMTPKAGEELVVLTHHPLNWFADSEDMTRFLHGRARVFISGHEHVAAVAIEAIEQGSDLMMLAAGATTPDNVGEDQTYAYNVIEFDWDEAVDALKVTIHPRIWKNNLKRFESAATGQGTYSLGSPNFRKAVRPAKEISVGVGAQSELMKVEIILPTEEVVTSSQIDETEYHNLYLRFFRDLDMESRLRIFVELGTIPADFKGNFNHETEGRLLRSLLSADKSKELHAKVESAIADRKKFREENE